MTKRHKSIIERLHSADKELRAAMVLTGGMVLMGQTNMGLVTNDILECEWYLDEAIAHTEAHAKVMTEKKLKKNLTSFVKCDRI